MNSQKVKKKWFSTVILDDLHSYRGMQFRFSPFQEYRLSKKRFLRRFFNPKNFTIGSGVDQNKRIFYTHRSENAHEKFEF